jgi:hypothetical protein
VTIICWQLVLIKQPSLNNGETAAAFVLANAEQSAQQHSAAVSSHTCQQGSSLR